MSRTIDRIPEPAEVKPKKLIILSSSRCGTLGIYRALGVLGLKAFHMVEVFDGGLDGVNILLEGLEYPLSGRGKPYGRKEFDKWFAKYDVINEMPQFMLPQFLEAYPDAKFLLTERNPDRWANSVMQTINAFGEAGRTFPMNWLKQFDVYTKNVFEVGILMEDWFTAGHRISEEGRQACIRHYEQYIAEVKRLVPPEQLTVVKLEEGLNWEQLCPLVDAPIPDVPWPTQHHADEFNSIMKGYCKPGIMRAFFKMSATIVPVVGVAAWYLLKGR
ncbi:hypothetical protein F4780DRAFT_751491 [Xylariomycetidae sp. FL0641]|nr:hypothetical protein F4780DRAFT_751491 [Xylariomycetidae sp. FL0641]